MIELIVGKGNVEQKVGDYPDLDTAEGAVYTTMRQGEWEWYELRQNGESVVSTHPDRSGVKTS